MANDPLVEVSVDHELKFELIIELGGDEKPSAEVVEKINEILGNISEKLKLK